MTDPHDLQTIPDDEIADLVRTGLAADYILEELHRRHPDLGTLYRAYLASVDVDLKRAGWRPFGPGPDLCDTPASRITEALHQHYLAIRARIVGDPQGGAQ